MKEKIIQLFKEGITYEEISKKLHCSKEIISLYCHKWIESTKYLPEKIVIYQQKYDSGLTLIDVCRLFNLNRQTLAKYLIQRNKKYIT